MKVDNLKNICTGILLFTSLLSTSASAALFDRGNGMIYDDVNNITWLQDANQRGVNMFWEEANEWASNLEYQGLTGWRLPSVDDPDATCDAGSSSGGACGYNTDTNFSEFAYMFHEYLGNPSIRDENNVIISNDYLENSLIKINSVYTNPETNQEITFENITTGHFWLGPKGHDPQVTSNWNFWAGYGSQTRIDGTTDAIAWAVRDGDVGGITVDVSEPNNLILFALSLTIFLSTRKRYNS